MKHMQNRSLSQSATNKDRWESLRTEFAQKAAWNAYRNSYKTFAQLSFLTPQVWSKRLNEQQSKALASADFLSLRLLNKDFYGAIRGYLDLIGQLDFVIASRIIDQFHQLQDAIILKDKELPAAMRSGGIPFSVRIKKKNKSIVTEWRRYAYSPVMKRSVSETIKTRNERGRIQKSQFFIKAKSTESAAIAGAKRNSVACQEVDELLCLVKEKNEACTEISQLLDRLEQIENRLQRKLVPEPEEGEKPTENPA